MNLTKLSEKDLISLQFCPDKGCSDLEPILKLNNCKFFYFIIFNILDECGNNITETLEECDDGNLVNEDGCNKYCKIEKRFYDPYYDAKCGNG